MDCGNCKPDSIPSVAQSFGVLKSDGRYLRFVLLMIVFWLAASQVDMTFPLRFRDESVSWMYAIYAPVTALFQYLSPPG